MHYFYLTLADKYTHVKDDGDINECVTPIDFKYFNKLSKVLKSL